MMTLIINKQKLYYALLEGERPIYQKDENGDVRYYEDSEGNKIPLETGETELYYGNAVPFFGNISTTSGGDSDAIEYGIDISAYDAILVMPKNSIPITETSILWFQSEVGYSDEDGKNIDPYSADYKVLAVKPSLNQDKYILGRLAK